MMLKKLSAQNVAMSSQFNVISTFSGCGGSSLGYELAGGEILLAIEWDNNAVETYRLNFPNTPIYHGDIAKLSVEECCKLANIKPGELDILDGSPPCQGFSTAGKRIMDDPRNSLFKEYVRLLRGLKPKVFVMENVSGLIKGKMKLVFAEIMKELKVSGYDVKCRLMNAKYYNVPQSRQRVIFIGVRSGADIELKFPSPQSKPIPTIDTIGHLSETNGPKLTPSSLKYWPKLKYGESGSKYHPKGSYFGMIKLDPEKPAPTVIRSRGIV